MGALASSPNRKAERNIEILRRRFEFGASQGEIAAALGLTKTNVKGVLESEQHRIYSFFKKGIPLSEIVDDYGLPFEIVDKLVKTAVAKEQSQIESWDREIAERDNEHNLAMISYGVEYCCALLEAHYRGKDVKALAGKFEISESSIFEHLGELLSSIRK